MTSNTSTYKHLLAAGILLCGLAGPAQAQKATWTADVPATDAAGFYDVPITPEISAHSRSDYADLRIVGPSGQVPYILRVEPWTETRQVYHKHPIVLLKHEPDSSIVEFRNDRGTYINNLVMEVQNARVSKHMRLTGSHDRETWFTIQEDYCKHNFDTGKPENVFKVLEFPWSNYPWLRLEISNRNSAPLNVLEIGWWETQIDSAGLNPVPPFQLTHSDSVHGVTEVMIANDAPFLYDQLVIQAAGAEFFTRNAVLLVQEMNRKGKTRWVRVKSFELNSDRHTYVSLTANDSERLRHGPVKLEIYNYDNPPIRIVRYEAYQRKRTATAWLEPNMPYKFTFGNSKARAPQYDLQYFRDRIPDVVPQLIPGDANLIATQVAATDEEKQQREIMLWGGLIVLVLFLGGMSYRMINELKRTSDEASA